MTTGRPLCDTLRLHNPDCNPHIASCSGRFVAVCVFSFLYQPTAAVYLQQNGALPQEFERIDDNGQEEQCLEHQCESPLL